MHKKVIFVFSVAFLFTGLAAAQADKGGDLLSFYDSQLIKIQSSGSGELLLSASGYTSGLAFGVNDKIGGLLKSYPDSKALFEDYQRDSRLGSWLLWGGLGVYVGGLGYFLASEDYDALPSSTNGIIFLSAMSVSVTSEIVSTIFSSRSVTSLFNSVNAYNRQRIAEYEEGR
jgi:hypothetical protein